MVGTHLLPPNLLKLFAPRPPLPYLKPTGRDPDLPLKSLSARRAPKPIVVSETLRQIREEQDQKERDAVEKGERPDRGEAEDQGVGADTKQKAEQAEVKVEEATGGEVPAKPDGDAAVKPEGTSAMAEDKEEGEEPDRAAAAAIAASAKGGKKDLKASQPTDAVTVDLCEEEKFQLRKRERQRKREEAMSKPFAPQDDEEICGDPYKTLFVGRLPLDVTEKDLLREFEIYGPIERLRLVADVHTGKSKGYAFIVYERERDMKAAYKDADGLKMKGKRVLIDVERGRTVKGWKPRRLGGGLGGRIKKLKGGIPAPEPVPFAPSFAPRGGFMGGGRGGFRGGRGGFRGGFGGGRGGFGGGGGNFNGPAPGNFGPPGQGYGGRGGFQGGGVGYGGMGRGGYGGGPPPGGPGGPPGGPGMFAQGEKRSFGDGPGAYGPGPGPGGPGMGGPGMGGPGMGGGGGYPDEKRLRY